MCLDAELLPWNARGDALVRRQFASVGAAARASLDATRTVLEATGDRVDVTDLRATVAHRVAAADRFTDVYRSYGRGRGHGRQATAAHLARPW